LPAVDLDHAATTRPRPEALAASAPFREHRYGNPSGTHALARDAVRALDEAREQVAEVLGRDPGEVVFTSGGTESDVHAVTGGLPVRSGVPVCPASEHHAVLDTVLALDGRVVAVDRFARVDRDALAGTLDELTAARAAGTGPGAGIVSVMLANNELGTTNDLNAVAEVIERHAPGVPLHTDAVQAAAWLDLATAAAPADLVTLSGHKFGGPRGSGVLVVGGDVDLRPLLHGGGQERGRRSGSVDVAGAVGLAAALVAAAAERSRVVGEVARRRDDLLRGLRERIDGLVPTVTDPGVEVLANFAHVMVPGVEAEPLLFLVDRGGVRASAASSCASGALESSHVLEAIDRAGGAIVGAPLRLTLGPTTSDADVRRAVEVIADAVERLRSHDPAGRS
jgi:cysteine desulfurase